MASYQNHDDAFYSSIGVQFATNGEWRPSIQPLGLTSSENYFAANPLLTPYLTAASVKLFGPDRWSLKLPSLIAFLAAGLALIWMVHVAKLSSAHSLVIMFSYYACPWLYYAMNTARAEPMCIAGLYLATLLSLIGVKSTRTVCTSVWILLSGALVTIVAWNHLLFSMAALLPALAIWGFDHKASRWKRICLWLAGAVMMLFVLIVWRVIPHWDAWNEQFLQNAASNAAISSNISTLESFKSTAPFPLNELVELKARFSTLGWPFMSWYAGIPLLFLLFLRPTRLFLLTLVLLLTFLGLIEIKTPVFATYVVNFAIAIPLSLLFAESRSQHQPLPNIIISVLGTLIVIFSILNAWLVLRPTTRVNNWSTAEQQIDREFMALPPHSIIWGDTAHGIVPAWRHGHAYYTTFNFLSNILGVKEKLMNMSNESGHYRLKSLNGEWQVIWQGNRNQHTVNEIDPIQLQQDLSK